MPRAGHCLVASILAATLPSARSAEAIPPELARQYFEEAQAICEADDGRLWGVSLCGPLLIADPGSRRVVASRADAGRKLTEQQGCSSARCPPSVNVANTALEWSGVRWTGLQWPLPESRDARATLLMHEAFHRIQWSVARSSTAE